jgi:hypothetical protein
VERTLLTGMDFLDGDIDFVRRLARGEFEPRNSRIAEPGA